MGHCKVSHKCREHRQGCEVTEIMGDAPTLGGGPFKIWCVCVSECGGGEPFKISLGEELESIHGEACGGLPRKERISCEGLYRSWFSEKYYFAAKLDTLSQLN